MIIGAGMPTKTFYDAYRMARKFDKKLILHPSYHDVSYYKNSIFFKKSLNFADKIIYQTTFEKDGLKKSYRINTNKLVQLTYCPYSKGDWLKASEKARLKEKEIANKIKKDLSITIGFVGQITLRKSFQFFVNFIDKNLINFKKRGLKVNFLFAGAKTNSSKEVELLFDKYKDLVKFFYNFPEKDKVKIFNKIDIFVNPSEEESLGLVNFEALKYGLVPYVSNKSAFFSLSLLDQHNSLKTLNTFNQISSSLNQTYKKLENSYTKEKYEQEFLKMIE